MIGSRASRERRGLFSPAKIISWRGVAKKRRKQEPAAADAKCSPTVATPQHSLRDGNHLLTQGGDHCTTCRRPCNVLPSARRLLPAPSQQENRHRGELD